MSEKPWTSGPKELLDHATGHLRLGTSFDYRIAFISIDNAVELAIRTYLSLPTRISGIEGPSRREMQSAYSFPDLLDLLEKHATELLSGVELGDIEWYHRLRNALYHEGNGVTVDPEKVDAYYQIATLLFQNLFAPSELIPSEFQASTLLGEFIIKWAQLEKRLQQLGETHLPRAGRGIRSGISLFDGLIAKGILPTTFRSGLEELSAFRNSTVHSASPPDAESLKIHLERLDAIINSLPDKDGA